MVALGMLSRVHYVIISLSSERWAGVGLSRRSWSPATTGPPGPSMAAMDSPLCRKWSPGSKPEKQWLQLQIDLYNNKIILTDEFEVIIKIFRNNTTHVLLLLLLLLM